MAQAEDFSVSFYYEVRIKPAGREVQRPLQRKPLLFLGPGFSGRLDIPQFKPGEIFPRFKFKRHFHDGGFSQPMGWRYLADDAYKIFFPAQQRE